MKRTMFVLSLLVLTFTALYLLQPPGAYVAFSASRNAQLAGAKPYINPSGNMTYHGGPVMAGTSNAYAIFWEPKGSYVSPTYNKLILRYFRDVGNSPLYHNNHQYYDSHGTFPRNAVLAGSWVDTAAYPSNPIYDADIQNEVTHAQQVNSWPSSIHTIFFVYTARGEVECSQWGCSGHNYDAYHFYFVFKPTTIYAVMPYNGCFVPSSPNHDCDADTEITLTSHEQIESATDPLLNAWYYNTDNGGEIGDLCFGVYGPLNKYGGDVLWDGHPYMVQKEWDNAKSACVLKGP